MSIMPVNFNTIAVRQGRYVKRGGTRRHEIIGIFLDVEANEIASENASQNLSRHREGSTVKFNQE